MKAILIDSKNKVIKEVEISKENTLKDWYKEVNCNMVEIAHYLENTDTVLVNEEGLLHDEYYFFTYEGAHQPFAGNGLVVGIDDEGNSVDCKTDIQEVKRNVKIY